MTIPAYTKRLDWELEFGIFIGKEGRDIPAEKAREYIGGFSIFNDFSARDIQGQEMKSRLGPAKGKDFDGGNAIGPVLVTPDEIPDPYNLSMKARVNGEEVSVGNTRGMHWTFEQMIAYVSQGETLHPGEFFASGTATVPESGKDRRGCGLEMGRFLKAGDTVELEVERIGVLTNYIVVPGHDFISQTAGCYLTEAIDCPVNLANFPGKLNTSCRTFQAIEVETLTSRLEVFEPERRGLENSLTTNSRRLCPCAANDLPLS